MRRRNAAGIGTADNRVNDNGVNDNRVNDNRVNDKRVKGSPFPWEPGSERVAVGQGT